MAPSTKPCNCGFGHTRKSAFGNTADSFFKLKDSPVTPSKVSSCLQYGVYSANNAAPLQRFGSARKTRMGGPMTISKKN
jgi:hypothetical protein